MKKHHAATIAALAAATCLGLAACAGGGGGNPTGGGGSPTTITLWDSFTSSTQSAFEGMVAKFNQSQSDVIVDVSTMPNDVLSQKLLPAYGAGKGPTLAIVAASSFPSYASKGVLAPLDDVYGSGGLDQSTLPAAALKATTWQGKQYGVPGSFGCTALYYNKTIFQQVGITAPPTTIDELVADAIKATSYNASDAAGSRYGLILPDSPAAQEYQVLMWNEGGGIVSADGTKSTFGDPASIASLKKWTGLVAQQHISPLGVTASQEINLMSAGKVAMMITGTWGAKSLRDAKIDFGIAPIPAGSAASTCAATSWNFQLSAAANPAEKAAAVKFLRFWNSNDAQTSWANTSGYPPNVTTVDLNGVTNPDTKAFAVASDPKKVEARIYLLGVLAARQIDTDVVYPTIQRLERGESASSLMPPASSQIDTLLKSQ